MGRSATLSSTTDMESGNVALHQRILKYTPRLKKISFFCESLFNILEMFAVMPESLEWNAIEVVVKEVARWDLEWIALDKALAAPKFCNLERFSLVNRSNYIPPFTDEVRGLMPLATARRILV
jgi:hypothetical protein